MQYHQPIFREDGTTAVCLPLEIALEGRKRWEICLVGSFVEKKPSFHSIQSLAMRLRKKYGIKEIMMNEKGFFFFKFAEETSILQCLEDGPWLFQNRPILLQKWQPQIELNNEFPRTVPLWVKLYDVPLELWTHEGLSYIASGVGKPLGMDRITEDACCLRAGCVGYAQILVEVKACCKLPEVVTIFSMTTELQIPQIEIHDNTESLIRNVMALEQCHYPFQTLVCGYVTLMKLLIKTEEDVDLLVEEGIISADSLGSSTEIKDMFNKLCLQIPKSISHYSALCVDLRCLYYSRNRVGNIMAYDSEGCSCILFFICDTNGMFYHSNCSSHVTPIGM
ncbi:hypothetical protein Pint_11879 [Pistacia integerrima]|uniref:Uncharacterized protein n=1 Tax=Pistacia integerrima TaxID=434235 RepID=A0ACC0XH61_9ROSI|nr:hypothetical protein Pint_11879 [Pistacia integerrima]